MKKRLCRRLDRVFAMTMVVLLLFTFSCGGQKETPAASPAASKSAEPRPGGVLTITMGQDPPSLDPCANALYTQDIDALVYSRLLTYKGGPDVDFTAVVVAPDLAETWEQTDDTTYVFHLRKGVKFQNIAPVNGREVTADDVKYSFEYFARKECAIKFEFAAISKIEVPDKYTVKITLKEPFAAFITQIADVYNVIVPKELVEQDGDLTKHAIGSGPFILESFEHNTGAVLKKNPDYYVQGRPYLDGVKFVIIQDEAARIAAFNAKQVDVGFQIECDPRQIGEVKKNNPDAVIEKFLLGSGDVLRMLPNADPFKDVRVRRAVALAIDRPGMIQSIVQGDGEWDQPIISPVHADVALPQDELAKYYARDVAKAKQLLADAGFPNGLDLTLDITNGYGPRYNSDAEMLQANLKDAGIRVTLRNKEYATFLTDKRKQVLPWHLTPVKPAFYEPDGWIYDPLHSKGSKNYTSLADPKLDQMLEQQRGMRDADQRKKLLMDIQRYIAEQAYQIPLYTCYGYQYSRPFIKNWRFQAFLRGFPALPNVWLDK